MTRSSIPGIMTHALAYGVGIGVGILLGRRYYKANYERIMQEERALAKHYADIKRKKQAKKAKKEKPVEEPTDDFEIFEGEFEDDGNPYNLGWDPTDLNYEEEAKHRSDEAPYVISKNEYDYDKPQYAKVDLEYYQLEEVLLDDRIEPMTDVDDIVGNDNLKRFGHGSGDRRMVYIRNEELETDFEVRLMMGSYAIDVLGLDDPHDEGKRWKPPR